MKTVPEVGEMKALSPLLDEEPEVAAARAAKRLTATVKKRILTSIRVCVCVCICCRIRTQ